MQLYNFRYADGRQMHTYGGIFIEPEQKKPLEASGILDLDFIRTGNEFYSIKIPSLTVKELKFLESYVPKNSGRRKPRRFEIQQDEFTQYCEAYRYYPTYAELES